MNLQAPPQPTIVFGIDSTLKLAAKGDLQAIQNVLAESPELLNAMSDGHHRTLLWEAANANRLALVEYLIEHGANPNIPGRYRSETFVLLTPYCIAKKRRRYKIAEFLLANGAELDIYAAAFMGDMIRLEEWISRQPSLVNARHPSDRAWDVTPLHYAITGEQIEAAEYLIAQGTEVTSHSELLFDIACRIGRMDLIELLFSAGADPSQTEVFPVLYKGKAEIIEFFFRKGVDVNKKDRNRGWPPIVYVSRGDKGEHPEKVKALIDYGADVDARGPKGITALHAAAKAGFARVIKVLLEAGADINATTDTGKTPLDLAIKHKRQAASELLNKSSPK
ncbi:MAG: ankyrin repeat domain-containing protein [Chloroflexota bacterium]